MAESHARAKTTTLETPDTKAKSKQILRKIAALLISTFVCVSIFFGIDFYLHRKHGVNLWGYRGPAVGLKQPGEKRVAVLGGSTTWGYGLAVGQDFPAQLQRQLTKANAGKGPINLLNLGFNNEGAYSFTNTMNDYDYLNYDVVLFYSGYNDLGGPNLYVLRHRSPVFLWTGYLPLLPTLTADKISQWQQTTSGKPNKTVFQPPDQNQLDRAAQLEKQIGNLDGASAPGSQSTSATCPAEWQFYCERIYEATELALKKGKRVLIVGEPYISDKHINQQTALENMIRARFAGQTKVRYLTLGGVVDLRDRSLCWDGMHLTEEGNRRIADALAKPVLDLIKD
ncbi:MAG: SGNH/GDSL hydrolase family protein [Pyrinomonadaceae bacterium]